MSLIRKLARRFGFKGSREKKTGKINRDVIDTNAFGVRYVDHNIPKRLEPGCTYGFTVNLENTGTITWQANNKSGNDIDLLISIHGENVATHKLSRSQVLPGEVDFVRFPFQAPRKTGTFELRIELVQQQGTLFADHGVPPLQVDIKVEEGDVTPNAEYQDVCQRIDPYGYQPTRGIDRGSDGRTYPLFIQRAKGYRLWDLEGKEYVDYTMGFGSTLLGYGDDRIIEAVREVLDTRTPDADAASPGDGSFPDAD